VFEGWDVDAAATDTAGVAAWDGQPRADGYVFSAVERERRLFGDSRLRCGPGSTGEYEDRWLRLATDGVPSGVIVYRRRDDTVDTVGPAAYRACLLKLGMDDERCAAILQREGDSTAQFRLQKAVLGQWDGQPEPRGLCGPLADDTSTAQTAARLWSGTCRDFCRDERTRRDALCAKGLRAYCAPQTRGDAADPVCACYMSNAPRPLLMHA
jgi:hypothetical protein